MAQRQQNNQKLNLKETLQLRKNRQRGHSEAQIHLYPNPGFFCSWILVTTLASSIWLLWAMETCVGALASSGVLVFLKVSCSKIHSRLENRESCRKHLNTEPVSAELWDRTKHPQSYDPSGHLVWSEKVWGTLMVKRRKERSIKIL